MNPLDILDEDQLQVFRLNKREMSCMDKPHTFLKQLRDSKLIPEEKYKKVIRIKNTDRMKTSVYELLHWIETERPQNIRLFWICVFKEIIMTQYPTLKRLRDSLFDGSPLQDQLPVTCGDQQGALDPAKLEKGEACIWFDQKWIFPSEFEKLGGKQSSKKWKMSILYQGVPLERLLTNKQLRYPGYNKTKAKRSTLPCSSNTVISDSEEEMEEEEGEEEEGEEEEGEEKEVSANLGEDEVSQEDEEEVQGKDCCIQRSDTGSPLQDQLPVTCGDQQGALDPAKLEKGEPCIQIGQNWYLPSEFEKLGGKQSSRNWKMGIRCKEDPLTKLLTAKRSTLPCSSNTGRCGKSIRTEDRWMSPVEFVEAGSAAGPPRALWRRDIQWEGKPLNCLIEDEQNNDYFCFVCRDEVEGDLVMCDRCPRSFHPECHLPRVDPSTLEPWMCTFCIWNINEVYRSPMSHEEMLLCPVSACMLQCHYLLLSLYNADKDHIFAKDTWIHVRGYSSQIVTPMWLDKITEQLLVQQYNTVGQFSTDIQLIFSNCSQFNQNNAEILDMGVRLKEFYEREVEKVFCIRQQSTVTCSR